MVKCTAHIEKSDMGGVCSRKMHGSEWKRLIWTVTSRKNRTAQNGNVDLGGAFDMDEPWSTDKIGPKP